MIKIGSHASLANRRTARRPLLSIESGPSPSRSIQVNPTITKSSITAAHQATARSDFLLREERVMLDQIPARALKTQSSARAAKIAFIWHAQRFS